MFDQSREICGLWGEEAGAEVDVGGRMMGAQAPMMPKVTSSLRAKSVGGPNGEGLGDLHSCQSVPYTYPRHVVRENLLIV